MSSVYEPIRIIEIDGKTLPQDISDKVEQFSYEDHEDKLDELKLTIVDAPIELCDHPMLQEGKDVRARWGYIGNLSEMRTCTIKEINYSFPEDGMPRIDIVAFGKGHKLTGRSARTCWNNKKLESVVSDIAKKHNFTPVIDIPGDSTREFVSQGGKNDMEFLCGLAEEMGCKMWVKNDELHFEPNLTASPALTFRYREESLGSLISFSVTTNAEKGKGTGLETEKAGIDPLTKKPFQETATARDEGITIKLDTVRKEQETPPAPRHDESGNAKPTPSHTRQEAKQEARGKVQTSGMGTVEGQAEIIGNPHIKAKDSIRIENISKKLSGVWRVKKVTHSFADDKYTCSLEVVRSDTNTDSGGKSGTEGASKGKNADPAAGKPTQIEVDLN